MVILFLGVLHIYIITMVYQQSREQKRVRGQLAPGANSPRSPLMLLYFSSLLDIHVHFQTMFKIGSRRVYRFSFLHVYTKNMVQVWEINLMKSIIITPTASVILPVLKKQFAANQQFPFQVRGLVHCQIVWKYKKIKKKTKAFIVTLV